MFYFCHKQPFKYELTFNLQLRTIKDSNRHKTTVFTGCLEIKGY